MALWRLASSHLRSEITKDQNYIDDLEAAVAALCEDFTAAFGPWENPQVGDEGQRNENLKDLLRRAADVGILLFSQTASFHFHWEPRPDADKTRDLVVWPRLLKVQDENARWLRPNQLLVDVNIERLFPPPDMTSTQVSANLENCSAEMSSEHQNAEIADSGSPPWPSDEKEMITTCRNPSTAGDVPRGRHENPPVMANFAGCLPTAALLPPISHGVAMAELDISTRDDFSRCDMLPLQRAFTDPSISQGTLEFHKAELEDTPPELPPKPENYLRKSHEKVIRRKFGKSGLAVT